MTESNATAAMTRNFLVDPDELVDELLAAIKQCGWRDLKMQYQLSKLNASKNDDAKEVHALEAEWKEFDEEVQLRICIAGSPESLPERQQKCLELMDALFANEIFRRVNEEN